MEIYRPGGATLAACEIAIGAIIIRNVTLVRSRSGTLFVALPSRRGPGGRWQTLVEFLSASLAERVRDVILIEYRQRTGAAEDHSITSRS